MESGSKISWSPSAFAAPDWRILIVWRKSRPGCIYHLSVWEYMWTCPCQATWRRGRAVLLYHTPVKKEGLRVFTGGSKRGQFKGQVCSHAYLTVQAYPKVLKSHWKEMVPHNKMHVNPIRSTWAWFCWHSEDLGVITQEQSRVDRQSTSFPWVKLPTWTCSATPVRMAKHWTEGSWFSFYPLFQSLLFCDCREIHIRQWQVFSYLKDR